MTKNIPQTNQLDKNNNILIVGAGMVGLSAAVTLAQNGQQVTLIEAEAELGGLCGVARMGNIRIEKYYHQWYPNDDDVINFLQRINCVEKMTCKPVTTKSYFNKSSTKFEKIEDVSSVSTLSLFEKLRLGLAVIRLKFIRDWRKLDDVRLEDFLVPYCGAKVFDKVWRPVLRTKFGQLAEDVSAVWLWSKLNNKNLGTSGKSTSVAPISYYEGGFAALLDDIENHLRAGNAQVKKATRLCKLGAFENGIANSGFSCTLEGPEGLSTTRFSHVVLTCAPDVINQIADRSVLPDPLADVPYIGNICLILKLDRSLTQAYWTSVSDPEFPFVGVIEHTNLMDEARLDGDKIIYLSRYIDKEAQLFNVDDKEYLDDCLPYLENMFPQFSRDWIKDYAVWRTQYGQPVAITGFSDLVPPKRLPHAGLYACNMAQIHPGFRGTGVALKDGDEIAQLMIEDINSDNSANGVNGR